MEACAFHIRNSQVLDLLEDLKTLGIEDLNVTTKYGHGKTAKIFNIIKIITEKYHQNDEKIIHIANKAREVTKLMSTLGFTCKPIKFFTALLQFILLLVILIIELPIVIPSVIVNSIPFLSAKKLGKKLAGKDFSLIPAARLMMGVVFFLLFYVLLFIITGYFIGIAKAALLSIFFMLGGYTSLCYWEGIKSFIFAIRNLHLWLFKPDSMRLLIKKRKDILAEMIKLFTSIKF